MLFRQGIVSDYCTVETCANDIILTVDWECAVVSLTNGLLSIV